MSIKLSFFLCTFALMKNSIFIIMMLTLMVASCNKKEHHEADDLMIQIRTEVNEGRYDAAIKHIDSLRANFPQCVEARRDALKLYQVANEKQAQADLMRTDSLLELAKARFANLNSQMEKGLLPAGQSHLLTEARMTRDSLQIRYETIGAKIRYIHKRQKENK